MDNKHIIIDDSSVFEINKPRILVRNDIHHGKMYAHEHTFFEFVYVDKGFSFHSFNGKITILTPGDLFAVSPGNIHSYFSAYQASIYNFLFDWAELSDDKEQILKLPGFSDGEKFPLVKVDINDRQELILILEKIKWERQNMCTGWELAVKSYLLQVIVIFSRLVQNKGISENGNKKNGEYFGHVYRALEYIENNYQKNINSNDIAGFIGLSPGYLAKQFKSKLYMTPAEYIRRFRVAKAMELLKTTKKSVSEIANDIGYDDISLFSRIFKQMTGKSPMSLKINKKI